MMKSSLIKILLATFFLVLSACGSDDGSSGSTSNSASTKPTAEIRHQYGSMTAPASGDIAGLAVDSQVTFSVIASAAGNKTISSYNWDDPLPVGVTKISGPTSDGSITLQFTTSSPTIIGLTVTDSAGVTSDKISVSVTMASSQANQPPLVSILHDGGNGGTPNLTNTPITITTGTTIQFKSGASDPEQDTLTLTWDFGGLVPTPSDPTATIPVTFSSANSYTIKLTANDGNNPDVSAQITVNVQDPVAGAPDGSITHDGPGGSGNISIDAGREVSFTGSPSGAGYTYAWDIGSAQLVSGDVATVGPIKLKFPSENSYSIALTVSLNGVADSTPATVSVSAKNPHATISYTANGSSGSGDTTITTGSAINFSATPTDTTLDTAGYTYAWSFSGTPANGAPSPASGQNSGNITFNTAGVYTVTLTTTNGYNVADPSPASIMVTVQDQTAPTSVISHDGPGGSGDITIDAGREVTFNGSPSGAGYTYSWNIGNAQLISGDIATAGPIKLKFPNESSYSVGLTVSLNGVAGTPATVNVSAKEPHATIAYSINGVSGSGNTTVTTGSTFNFSANPVDSTLNTAAYTYAWSFVGTPANGAPNAANGQNLSNITFATAGTYTVTLTTTNGYNVADSTPPNIVVTVQDQAPPPDATITYIVNSATGSTDFSIDTGTQVAFGVTPPLDATFTYNWAFNSALANTTGTVVSLSYDPTSVYNVAGDLVNVSFDQAGIYNVSLTAVDASGTSDPTPAQVVVTVTDPPPPVFTIVHDDGTGDGNITRTNDINIISGDTVVFNYTTTAADLTNYAISWDFDGPTATVDTATGNQSVTYDGSWLGLSSGAGTYFATLIITDNSTATPTTSTQQITVNVADPANLPPDGSIAHDLGSAIPSSIAQFGIVAGASVAFTGSGSDPEGTAISYNWTVTSLRGSTFADATQNPTFVFDSPDVYTVSLTVSDATGLPDPIPASVEVTVLPAFNPLPVLAPTSSVTNNDGSHTLQYDMSVEQGVLVDIAANDQDPWKTPMFRYNGLQLPPVIAVARGDDVTVNVTNNLPITTDAANDPNITTVHWHGLRVDAANDGGPDWPIFPSGTANAQGNTGKYHFVLQQPAAPLWFHPHPDMQTATQVYNGLAGALVVTDTISEDLKTSNQLPSGDHELSLLLQDRSFGPVDANGQRALSYTPNVMAGMLGNTVLVNYVKLPGKIVDTRQYRLRIYNGSNARSYDIGLSNNAQFAVIGSDGGLLPAPVNVTEVMIAPGERTEIVVDFSTNVAGDTIILQSKAFQAATMGMGGGGGPANGTAFDLMRFEVRQQVTDTVTLYSALPNTADIYTRYAATAAPGTALPAAPFNERPFVMSMAGGAGAPMTFLINNTPYDPNVINETIDLTTATNNIATEVWSISNPGGGMGAMMAMAHPFHAHAVQWQVLDRSRNGVVTAPLPMDSGWKDTFLVQPGEVVRVMGRFDASVNSGKYMYHCHILEHEDSGMMGTFEVVVP